VLITDLLFSKIVASPVFRSMFGTEMKEKKKGEVVIKDIDIKILRLMIQWIYLGEIEVHELQDKMDLFKAAHKYQVETLKDWCIVEICANISPDNVLRTYDFGESYDETRIKNKALKIMKA
jgi:hypothetical protein